MMFLLPHAIDLIAQSDPQREAIRYRDQSLTYAELAKKSNCLAMALREQGVKRRDRVGILAGKSLESAISMYGIMKAGAAYVPIDPASSKERMALIIRDCGIRHLVTQDSKREILQALLSLQTNLSGIIGINLDAGLKVSCVGWNEVLGQCGNSAPDLGTTEQDLAYIIYTSGSTGEPKGIMHTHHSGLSFARWAASEYAIHGKDRLTNHSPLHFDMSIFDFFAGAVAGAATVIVPEEHMKLAASYSQLLADEKISVLFTVPFALIQLASRGMLDVRDLSALRWVIFGGEPYPTKHLRNLMTLLPQARFDNMYGPAETNGCTHYTVPPLAEDNDEGVPIGKICSNAEALVIDEQDRPLPAGKIGELLIRSPTMMQGYWGRPELNRRAFYRRQIAVDYNDVFYRTGDLVALQDDGNFQFVGRRDRQIKIRGYRVELDEIEAAITANMHVEETAAFAVSDGNGSLQIHAAATLHTAGSIASGELMAYLRRQLPFYAVPTHFEIRNSFPRTTSGKIDRRQLQSMAASVDLAQ